MIDFGYLHEAFLLGDAGLELESYPREVGRVYAEDFVQEVSAVFPEGNDVVSFALHSFGIVLHEYQPSGGVEAERACHPQCFVDVGGEVADVEDGLPFGQGRINPQGI